MLRSQDIEFFIILYISVLFSINNNNKKVSCVYILVRVLSDVGTQGIDFRL